MRRAGLFFCMCAALAAGSFGGAPAVLAAENKARDEQARIVFADMGGVRNWKAQDKDTLFVLSRRGQWYRAEMLGPCTGLPFAHTVGFVFEPDGSLDRFSSIVVDGRECQFRSLVKTEAPHEADTSKMAEQKQAPAPDPKSAASDKTSADDDRDARIPFANLGGIENWEAVDDDTLYIEGRRDQWYRAELFGSCPGLRFETSVGFVTRPIGSFDEFSSIVVDGRECQLRSLTESGPPPDKG